MSALLLLLGLLACGRPPDAPVGGLVGDSLGEGAPARSPALPPVPQPAPTADAPPDAPPPPPALDPAAPRQTVTMSALVACTRMMCPPDRPCCNQCSAMFWAKGRMRAAAAAGAAALPTLSPDGCGQVTDDLVVTGVELDGTLWAESWALQPRPPAAP